MCRGFVPRLLFPPHDVVRRMRARASLKPLHRRTLPVLCSRCRLELSVVACPRAASESTQLALHVLAFLVFRTELLRLVFDIETDGSLVRLCRQRGGDGAGV